MSAFAAFEKSDGDILGNQLSGLKMLLELVDSLPVDHFTLEWLLGRLDRRSFGIVLLDSVAGGIGAGSFDVGRAATRGPGI